MSTFRALTIQSGVLTQQKDLDSLVVGSGISTLDGYNLAISPAGGSITTTANLVGSGGSSLNFSGSTGTVQTGTGAVSINGDATLAAGKNLTATAGGGSVDFSGMTGTFKTSVGANTLEGDVSVATNKTFSTAGGTGTFSWSASTGSFDTSTGAVGINGSATLAANKSFTAVAGTGSFDFSAASGAFSSSTGANTLNGDVTVAANKNLSGATGSGTFSWKNSSGAFDTSTGAVGINGSVTLAANKSFTAVSGTGSFDFSAASGAFSTSTGAVTVGGAADFTAAGMALTVDHDEWVKGTLYANTWLAPTGSSSMQIGGSGTTVTVPGNLVVQGTETVVGTTEFDYPVKFDSNISQTDGYMAQFGYIKSDNGITVDGYMTQSGGAISLNGNTDSTIKTSAGSLTLDGYAGLNLLVNGSPLLDISPGAITIPAGVVLGTTGSGNINLPNNASAKFEIEGVSVDGYVTANNLSTLTDGGDATLLHTHSAGSLAWGQLAPSVSGLTGSLSSGVVGYVDSSGALVQTDSSIITSSYMAGVGTSTTNLQVAGVVSVVATSSLTVGGPVYLDQGANAGKVTSVAPSSGVVAQVGIAVSASKMLIQVMPPVVL